MIHSSYYISSMDAACRPFSEPFLVLGDHETVTPADLVAGAVADGVRTIVIERSRAGSYCRPFERELVGGVSYFFVRSLSATLSRWQAIPLVKAE